MNRVAGLDDVRLVADAVLYEGYLLYPYRSTSAKNQVRWQFGVLGPPGAAAAGTGEEPDLAIECLLRNRDRGGADAGQITVHLRFLHLQTRRVQRAAGSGPDGGFQPVSELRSGTRTWLSWDEAVERELPLGPYRVADLAGPGVRELVEVAGGAEVEQLRAADGEADSADVGRLIGRVIRTREPLRVRVTVAATDLGNDLCRLAVGVQNLSETPGQGREAATACSLLGTHLIVVAAGVEFVSVIDPPPAAAAAAAGCTQHRCWPVLAGSPGRSDVVLGSPIILDDHPAVAAESAGSLFDATEIDEILTLRVMAMTDDEKAAARATDPQAAAIVDRCDALTSEQLQRMHGVLRDPHRVEPLEPPEAPAQPWWDPEADAGVDPAVDRVLVRGVQVARGSRVRLRPGRRADAQDLFLVGQEARVTAVLADVDGGTHVAVVLVDDPAADLHEWYGRYLYFAPDELEPLMGEER